MTSLFRPLPAPVAVDYVDANENIYQVIAERCRLAGRQLLLLLLLGANNADYAYAMCCI